MAATSFEQMGLDPRLLRAVAELGWAAPTAIQAEAIPLAMEGRDLLARARTGSGKTAAYGLPVLERLLRDKAVPVPQSVRALVLVPSKELGLQVVHTLRLLASFCARQVRVAEVCTHSDLAAQKPVLMEKPDVVVGTPGRVLAHINAHSLVLRDSLELLVLDEADLLLDFGFGDDLKALLCHLPKIYQALLMSATFNPDVEALKELVLHNPVTVQPPEPRLPCSSQLRQLVVRCELEEDKFLLLYAVLKLALLRGRALLFVSSISRCYRLKLFLEQFGIPACALNSELPARSRCHVITQFNRGLYDYIVATDEELTGDTGSNVEPRQRKKRKGNESKGGDPEYSVSRGIDFQNVATVINFDVPTTVESYIHRVGRTARADNPGTALTFVLPEEREQLAQIEDVLAGENGESMLQPYKFCMEEVEALRYRCRDAMRSVTKQAVKEARLREIKEELLNSEKLKTYFEDNPRDLHVLRHDKPLHPAIVKPHLRNVPEYLVPPTLRGVAKPEPKKRRRLRLPHGAARNKAGPRAAPELTPIHAAGYCAFYGSCGRNPELNGSLLSSDVPCLDNSPARVASAAVLPLLRTVCPELVRGDNDTRLCCSMAQLTALRLSVALSGAVLSRCPSCARNFANLHCSNICSPDQSLFINVTRVADPVSPSGRRAVLEYQSFYRRRYAEAAFDSCIGVRLPATGGFALDTMCGIYGARLCTAQRWLDFQGDINNGLAPLRIRFVLLPDGTEPGGGIVALNGSAWPCRGSPGPELQPCSCQDCAASCPPIVAPTGPPAPFRLGSADGALVLCALLFSFFALLFLTAITCGSAHTSGRSSSSTSTRSSSIPGSSSPRRGCCSRLSSGSHSTMAKLFRLWGTMVATRPVPVLVVSLVLVAGLGAGLHRVRLTTDPVELWSAPGSQARLEKDFHDRHFGPFFRTCQVIITEPRPGPAAPYHSVLLGSKNFSSVLNPAVLRELLRLQEELAELSVWVQEEQRAIQLKDVCYAPLNPGNATSADCCVNSVTQYFQNNRTRLAMEAAQSGDGTSGTADWRDHVMYCVNSPLSFMDITALEMSCMASYGGPVFPYIAFGGYPGSEYTEAEALILTYSLNNFPPGDPRQRWVLSWEERFLEELQRFQSKHSSNLSVSYMAERSLEDELSRTTAQDLPVFAVSYLLVFAYIALALGEFTAWRRVWVESKVTLALGGIAVVLGAVMAAMGLLALLGLPSSLIILEVVPFLVLAVGADNIFIFVQEYQQSEREPGETREQHIGRVLAQVAPSMMLCSLSEVICFCLGSLSSMPAVRTFALTAAVSIAFDFLLQMSAFVALLALDTRRQEAGRYDVCCCCGTEPRGHTGPGLRLLRPFMSRFYSPVLLHRWVRPAVVLLFLAFSFCGLYLMLQVEVGLDQELSMPTDSYMLRFFSAMERYLHVGVPTYFVTTSGFNFSSTLGSNAICSSAGCDNNSLTQTIQYATQFPNVSYLAIPATSWLDDFLDWLNPTGRCCRIHRYGEHSGEFCPSTSTSLGCLQCMNSSRRPTPAEFQHYLPWFLHDRPTLECAKGGLGAYDTAVSMDANGTILASRFMAYQRPLRTSQDFTAALRAARALAEEITTTLRKVPGTQPDFRVFPYTVTYVYYEQYLSVVLEGLLTMAMCLAPTFLVSFLLLGMDLRSSAATVITITMILLDTVGLMALWDIPYNAVALINLVAAVGISVEFVSHLTVAFAQSRRPTRVERAADATINMGSKVVAGVAMTNLPGVVVLAFAKAQLIQIFFFRLNFIITLVGLAHGLVFLPVLLSYIGPAPLSTGGTKSGTEGTENGMEGTKLGTKGTELGTKGTELGTKGTELGTEGTKDGTGCTKCGMGGTEGTRSGITNPGFEDAAPH